MDLTAQLTFKRNTGERARNAMIILLDDIETEERDHDKAERLSNAVSEQIRAAVDSYFGPFFLVPAEHIAKQLYERAENIRNGSVAYYVHTLARELENMSHASSMN